MKSKEQLIEAIHCISSFKNIFKYNFVSELNELFHRLTLYISLDTMSYPSIPNENYRVDSEFFINIIQSTALQDKQRDFLKNISPQSLANIITYLAENEVNPLLYAIIDSAYNLMQEEVSHQICRIIFAVQDIPDGRIESFLSSINKNAVLKKHVRNELDLANIFIMIYDERRASDHHIEAFEKYFGFTNKLNLSSIPSLVIKSRKEIYNLYERLSLLVIRAEALDVMISAPAYHLIDELTARAELIVNQREDEFHINEHYNSEIVNEIDQYFKEVKIKIWPARYYSAKNDINCYYNIINRWFLPPEYFSRSGSSLEEIVLKNLYADIKRTLDDRDFTIKDKSSHIKCKMHIFREINLNKKIPLEIVQQVMYKAFKVHHKFTPYGDDLKDILKYLSFNPLETIADITNLRIDGEPFFDFSILTAEINNLNLERNHALSEIEQADDNDAPSLKGESNETIGSFSDYFIGYPGEQNYSMNNGASSSLSTISSIDSLGVFIMDDVGNLPGASSF